MFRCILGEPPQVSWQEKLCFSRGSLSSVAVDKWYISERNIVKLCTYCWTSNFKFKAFELTPVKKLLICKVLIIPVEKFKSRHIWAEPTQGWTMFSFNHDPSIQKSSLCLYESRIEVIKTHFPEELWRIKYFSSKATDQLFPKYTFRVADSASCQRLVNISTQTHRAFFFLHMLSMRELIWNRVPLITGLPPSLFSFRIISSESVCSTFLYTAFWEAIYTLLAFLWFF